MGAIEQLEESQMKEDLLLKYYSKQNNAKEYKTQLNLVTNMIKNKKDVSRFLTGWHHIDDNIKDKNVAIKLRNVIVDKYVDSKETSTKDGPELLQVINEL